MGTRSLIARKLADGKYRTIYCHWDGYPSHQAPRLVAGYSTPAKVTQLMRLGDLSSLGYELGKKHDFDNHHSRWCTAYGRDRGAQHCESQVVEGHDGLRQLARSYGVDYVYLWNGTQWCYDTQPVGIDDDFSWTPCSDYNLAD